VDLRSGSKRPMLMDLGERGIIEQIADKIMFLYRPFYYGLTEGENGETTKNIAEVIMEKNNFGRIGTARLYYDQNISKFKDYYVSGRWEDEGDLKEFS